LNRSRAVHALRELPELPQSQPQGLEQLYYAENYARLVEVKQTYDPTNLFQNAQSVGTS
jgi:FAD/FMN-containing dehydrogenase